MDPVTGAAIIGAGASAISGGANAIANGSMNRATRKWNEKQYAKQKQDNIDFWNMQNSYNSPQAQMARFQEAGLNPNMMYGQGTNGNAEGISAPSSLPYKPNSPDIPNIAEGYLDTQMKQAQTDNVKQQGNLMMLDGLSKLQDIESKTLLNDYMSNFGYTYRRNRERDTAGLTTEKLMDASARNMMNFGASTIGQPIEKGSLFDLQAQGLQLINQLRATQNTNQGHISDINKIRSDYQKRISSGNLSDMGSKDVLQMLMQAIGLFK